MSSWSLVRQTLAGCCGIELGGPSALFRDPEHDCMLYDILRTLDGANMFNNNTFQTISSDVFEYAPGKKGYRFNADIVSEKDLSEISKKYPLIIASHVIEHIANPIKALKMWSEKILEAKGYLLLIAPNKQLCFDFGREDTGFSHILEDYEKNTPEADTSHLSEIVEKKAIPVGIKEYLEKAKENINTRVIHHHVFNLDTLKKTCEYSGYKTVACFNHPGNTLQNVYLGERI